jgi:SAM-dependent methyltransferase
MRDTDKDWIKIAEDRPYFGVLTNSKFANPTPEALVDFFRSGEDNVAHSLRVLRHFFGPFAPKSALDFGCGVGRLTIPLAKETGKAVGVDVAPKMRELAAKHGNAQGVDVEFVATVPDGRQFDFVISLIVLQHIPPQRGYRLIGDLWRAVASNGGFNIQFPIYKDQSHQGELIRDMRRYRFDGETAYNYSSDVEDAIQMSMYDYDLSRVLGEIESPDSIYLERTKHGGCHGVNLYARKR